MMDVTIKELLKRKLDVQSHQIRSDLVAASPKNQQVKAQAFSLQHQITVPSKNPHIPFSGNESLSCADKIGEKRKRIEYAEICDTENRSKSVDVVVNLGNKRVSSDIGDGREAFGIGKKLHEVDLCKETLPNAMNMRNSRVGAALENLEADNNSALSDTSSEVSGQPKTSECAGLKFNNFDKLREEVNFAVGQTWALYDSVDGMPRLYAQIRKVSAPSFGLRITYLEPDPDDDKELQWFEEDLPVSVEKARLGRFSRTGILSGLQSQILTAKYEYEFVEILSDYADEAGVYVAYLHKAKGFASVFFRMGTGYEGVFRILPRSLYRFSHRVPSFKLTGSEGRGVPKDAYELDQAALPETIEEKIVPSHRLGDPAASNHGSRRKSIYFARKGKVFQTGKIWSFCGDYQEFPLYYGRIQKITFTQVLEQKAVCKLHIGRLKAIRFPEDVMWYEDKNMPVGCGTFYARKALEIISPDDVSQQIVPQISLDGNKYTILPKIGEVWVIYRFWSEYRELDKVGLCSYDIVEILDDTLDYKVQLLERQHTYPVEYEDIDEDEDEEKKSILRLLKREKMFFKEVKEYKHNEIDGSEPIFTITKSERLRFSHKVPASRVTKEIHGEIKELIHVDSGALPDNMMDSDF